MAKTGEYASDRYITPGVIIALVLAAGVLGAAVIGGVTYLTAMGKNPEPITRLVLNIISAAGASITALLQLTGRTTAAKTERNTGLQAGVLAQHADAVNQLGYQVEDLRAVVASAATPAAAAAPADPYDEGLPLYAATEEAARRLPVPPIPS